MADDDFTPAPLLAMNVFVGKTESAVDTSAPAVVLNGPRLLTDHLCFNNFPVSEWPDLAVALQAVDWAGNASTIGPAKQLKVAGCQSAAGAPVLALLLLVLRRPRRAGSRVR